MSVFYRFCTCFTRFDSFLVRFGDVFGSVLETFLVRFSLVFGSVFIFFFFLFLLFFTLYFRYEAKKHNENLQSIKGFPFV